MSARKRDRRQLPAILALVAWILAAAAIAHPTPGAALGLAFVAGLVVGAAVVYHSDSRRRPSPPHGARRAAAVPPPRTAARARSRSPRPGPGALRPVPDAAALRANLAARADQVSTHVPAPSQAGERET